MNIQWSDETEKEVNKAAWLAMCETVCEMGDDCAEIIGIDADDMGSSNPIRENLNALLAAVRQVQRTNSWKSVLQLRRLKHAIRKPNGIDPYAELDLAARRAGSAYRMEESRTRATISRQDRRGLVPTADPSRHLRSLRHSRRPSYRGARAA